MVATIRAHPIIRHHLELGTPGAIRGRRTVSTCDIAVLADRDPLLQGFSTIMILTKEPMQVADPEPSMATDPTPAHPKATSPFGWISPLAAGRARGGPYRGRGRGAYQKIIPAERELLRARRDGIDDENLVAEGDGGIVYRDVDELSDDEEADMEISDNSDDESGEPSTKRARRSGNDESGNSIPKWSNPDPYTALPPPDAAERKKRDMVKMIRKARVDETAADKLAASTEAE
ncbi:hypothetical protein CTA2_3877, partial [Colletotrichum tanaceti]